MQDLQEDGVRPVLQPLADGRRVELGRIQRRERRQHLPARVVAAAHVVAVRGPGHGRLARLGSAVAARVDRVEVVADRPDHAAVAQIDVDGVQRDDEALVAGVGRVVHGGLGRRLDERARPRTRVDGRVARVAAGVDRDTSMVDELLDARKQQRVAVDGAPVAVDRAADPQRAAAGDDASRASRGSAAPGDPPLRHAAVYPVPEPRATELRNVAHPRTLRTCGASQRCWPWRPGNRGLGACSSRRRRDTRAAAVRRAGARPGLPGVLGEELRRGRDATSRTRSSPRPTPPSSAPRSRRVATPGRPRAPPRSRPSASASSPTTPRLGKIADETITAARPKVFEVQDHLGRGVQRRGRLEGRRRREGARPSASSSIPASTTCSSAGRTTAASTSPSTPRRAARRPLDLTRAARSLAKPPPGGPRSRAGPWRRRSSKPFGPAVFIIGAGLTAVGAGLTIWSGIDTQNNPGADAVKADCVGQGTSCPRVPAGPELAAADERPHRGDRRRRAW